MPKRKRGTAQSTASSSKRKRVVPPPHPHGAIDYDKEYKLRAIIGENKTQYQIDWEDDSETGEAYPPTWEPKANANALAVADWQSKKAGRTAEASNSATDPKKRGRRRRTTAGIPSAPAKTPARPSRITESSPGPPAQTAQSEDQDLPAPPSESAPIETEPELEIDESEPRDDGDSLPSVPADNPVLDGRRLEVQLSEPPSSYQAGRYQRIPEHRDSSRPSSRHDSSLTSSASLPITAAALPITTEVLQSTANEPVLSQAQNTGEQSTSLVIPESQSQQQVEETSSFQRIPTAAEPEAAQEAEAPSEKSSAQATEPARGNAASRETEQQPEQPAANETTVSDPSKDAPVEIELSQPDQPGEEAQSERGGREDAETAPSPAVEPPAANETAVSDPPKDAPVEIELSQPDQPGEEAQSERGAREDTETAPSPAVEPPAANKTTVSDPSKDAPDAPAEIELSQPDQPGEEARSERGDREDLETAPSPAVEPPAANKTTVSDPSKDAPDAPAEIELSQPDQPGEEAQSDRGAREDTETTTSPAVEPAAAQLVESSTSDTNPGLIVISSEIEHGENSSNLQPDNSAQFLSQAQFTPPPGGQLPIPSSVIKSSAEHYAQPAEVNRGTQETPGTQSSFPFQTQPEPPTSSARQIESKSSNATPKRAALFNPPLKPTGSRLPSVSSVRSFNSPLPPIPSQSLSTLGDSAPDRLRTPTPSQSSKTCPNMNPMNPSTASKSTTHSLSSQLKAMREGRRQTRRSQTPLAAKNAQPVSSLPPSMNAEVAAARMASSALSAPAPSAVPGIEPRPPVTREEMNTSERYGALLPQSQNNDLDYQDYSQMRRLVSSNPVIEPTDPNEDPEVANTHIVPVPFHGPQRDSYSNNVYHHNEVIERVLAERHPVRRLLEEAENLLQKLRNLATHPDLANHETLSQASEPDRQAQWDVDSSGKFCFLQKLFDALQELSQSTHVAVAAHGGRISDMLETFCNGWFYTYSRSGKEHVSTQPGKDKVRVTILDLDNETEMPKDADIVIALDGTTDYRHRVIRAARRHTKGEGMTGTNSWAMLLTLVVPKTVEHIERCLASDLPRAVRARVLIATARKLRHEACRKEHDGQAYAEEAAKKIVEYLDDPEATEWPIGLLSQIQDLDSQTETEPEISHADMSKEHDSSGHPTKRARLSADPAHLSGTMNPQDMEITHVSDSLGKTTQPSLNEVFAPPTGPSLREQQLEEELMRVQDRLEKHIRDLEEVQFRNEAQRTELAQKSSEREEAISRVGMALNRMTTAENNNSTLRAERTELQKQLNEANAKLLDNTVPGRADFERLRLEAEGANAAKDKADKSAEQAQNSIDWVRSKYQESENKARELQAENTDLQARLAIAEKQASGEMARARQLTQDNHYKKLDRENQKLRVIVKDREAAIRFRDEEITRLKETTRGRMGTRQSSVPRSPRLGSPMKLVTGGGGSRQASPATGEPVRGKGHPLRNLAG